MTEKDRDEFGRRVLRELRVILLDRRPEVGRSRDRISVEDVHLEATGPEHLLIILLREETRPECLFGWRWPLTPWLEDPVMTGDPNLLATIISANLEESLARAPGLPDECDPGNVTWF